MTYWLQQCSNSNQVTNGFSLWMTMWGLARPRTVTFKCTFKSNILQAHSKWHLLEPQCATDACFCLSPSGRLFISLWKKPSDLHSALNSQTITAHLNSNWSRHEDIRHGECSWILTVTTAVDVSRSALYLNVLDEGGHLHCQEGICPSQTSPDTHAPECQTWGCSVLAMHPLDPMNSPTNSFTEAQRLTRGYCGLMQKKSTVKHTKRRHTHTHRVKRRMDWQTDCCWTDKLLASGEEQPWTSKRYCSA